MPKIGLSQIAKRIIALEAMANPVVPKPGSKAKEKPLIDQRTEVFLPGQMPHFVEIKNQDGNKESKTGIKGKEKNSSDKNSNNENNSNGPSDPSTSLAASGADEPEDNEFSVLDQNKKNKKLRLYARTGNLEKVKKALSSGAELESTSSPGTTALMQAAAYGQNEVVEYLLSIEADIEAESTKGETAFSLAVNSEHEETAEILMNAGAKIIRVDKLGREKTPYPKGNSESAQRLRQEIIERSKEKFKDYSQVRLDDELIKIFTAEGKHQVRELKAMALVALGAEPNTVYPEFQSSILVTAVYKGWANLALSLLESGANPNDLDLQTGKSILSRVIEIMDHNHKYFKVAEKLLEKGANPDFYSAESELTILDKMLGEPDRNNTYKKKRFQKAAPLLVKAGARLNTQDDEGHSMPSRLVYSSGLDFVPLFQEAGLEFRFNKAEAKELYIKYLGSPEIRKFIKEHGEDFELSQNEIVQLFANALPNNRKRLDALISEHNANELLAEEDLRDWIMGSIQEDANDETANYLAKIYNKAGHPYINDPSNFHLASDLMRRTQKDLMSRHELITFLLGDSKDQLRRQVTQSLYSGIPLRRLIYLLQNQAVDIDSRDRRGRTALNLVLQHFRRYQELASPELRAKISLLIGHGANIFHPDNDGIWPVSLALNSGVPELANLFLKPILSGEIEIERNLNMANVDLSSATGMLVNIDLNNPMIRNLDKANLQGLVYVPGIKFPKGFKPSKAGMKSLGRIKKSKRIISRLGYKSINERLMPHLYKLENLVVDFKGADLDDPNILNLIVRLSNLNVRCTGIKISETDEDVPLVLLFHTKTIPSTLKSAFSEEILRMRRADPSFFSAPGNIKELLTIMQSMRDRSNRRR